MRVSSGQEIQTIVTIVVQEAAWHGGSDVLEGGAKTDCPYVRTQGCIYPERGR